MEPINEDLDDGTLDNGDGNPGNEDQGDEGQEGSQQSIKIGEQEYTPEQLNEIVKKSTDYDSLLPEFTRKSQRLSELEQQNNKPNEPKEEDPPYYDPNWQPKTYAELANAIKMAEDRGETRALQKLQQMDNQKTEARQQLDNFISGIRTKNKEFNEDDFYGFATKHKFPISTIKDLEAVYSAYSDLQNSIKTATKQVKDNKDKRDGDTVAGNKGGGKQVYAVSFSKIRQSSSAVDAVRDALQGKQ